MSCNFFRDRQFIYIFFKEIKSRKKEEDIHDKINLRKFSFFKQASLFIYNVKIFKEKNRLNVSCFKQHVLFPWKS